MGAGRPRPRLREKPLAPRTPEHGPSSTASYHVRVEATTGVYLAVARCATPAGAQAQLRTEAQRRARRRAGGVAAPHAACWRPARPARPGSRSSCGMVTSRSSMVARRAERATCGRRSTKGYRSTSWLVCFRLATQWSFVWRLSRMQMACLLARMRILHLAVNLCFAWASGAWHWTHLDSRADTPHQPWGLVRLRPTTPYGVLAPTRLVRFLTGARRHGAGRRGSTQVFHGGGLSQHLLGRPCFQIGHS